MSISDLFSSLTESQRAEFDSDLQSIFTEFQLHNAIVQGTVYELSTHLNLEESVFLFLTINFSIANDAKVHGEIKTFKKFKDKDEYLESVRIEKLSQNLQG
jgi:hypothetical protein